MQLGLPHCCLANSHGGSQHTLLSLGLPAFARVPSAQLHSQGCGVCSEMARPLLLYKEEQSAGDYNKIYCMDTQRHCTPMLFAGFAQSSAPAG